MIVTYPYWPGRRVGNPARKAAANGNPTKLEKSYLTVLLVSNLRKGNLHQDLLIIGGVEVAVAAKVIIYIAHFLVTEIF